MKIYYKKSLGQNFLRNEKIALKFSKLIPKEENFVIEIGAGKGAISKHLLNRAKNLILIEKDNRLVEELKKRFSLKSNIFILKRDATELELKEILPPGEKAIIVGNLPFNSAMKILFKFIEQTLFIKKMIFSFQKEVAERLLSMEGSKKYGIPSIIAKLFLEIKKLFEILPQAFFPTPEVTSTVLLLIPRENPLFQIEDIELFKKIVSASFYRRRKTILNSLKESRAFDKDIIKKLLLSSKIPFSKRAEEISIEKYFELYKELKNLGSR